MLDILVAHLLRLFREVVVAVGEAQAALVEVHDDHFGILRVGATSGVEETTDAVAVELAHQLGQVGLVVEAVDHVEIRLQFAVAASVDGDGVHACIVEVTDLLGYAALRGAGVLRHLIDDVLDQQLVALVNLGEGSVGGVLFRNRVVLQPLVVDEAEEIFSRVDYGVHVAQLDGWNNFFLGFRFRCLDCFFSAARCHCT